MHQRFSYYSKWFFSCLCLPSSLYHFFVSHLNQICILICPVGSVSHSFFFPLEYFSIFLSYLKNFYITVVRIFISNGWLKQNWDLSSLSVHYMCLALLYKQPLSLLELHLEATLNWGFLANLHVKLPFVEAEIYKTKN